MKKIILCLLAFSFFSACEKNKTATEKMETEEKRVNSQNVEAKEVVGENEKVDEPLDPHHNKLCPPHYVYIPKNALAGNHFCIAKYEMKRIGDLPHPQGKGMPWDFINRDGAQGKCKELGVNYSLPTYQQWQSVAANIAGVGENWSGGTVGKGQLNSGHTDNSPPTALEITNREDPCDGTGEKCSFSEWNSQRRTNKLSTQELIWDFGGNAWEWILVDDKTYEKNVEIAKKTGAPFLRIKYGSDEPCSIESSSPYCRVGYYYNTQTKASLLGGIWSYEYLAEALFASIEFTFSGYSNALIGFRCVVNL